MFRYFEQRITPFPDHAPPGYFRSLTDFIRQYSCGAEPYLLIMVSCTALTAMAEIFIFQFIGNLIDWISNTEPHVLWEQRGTDIAVTIVAIALGMPILISLHCLVSRQTLACHYPMRIRWLAHRHLLNQPMSFYRAELSGRLATKITQTAQAIPDSTMKILDIGVYALVSFGSIVVVISQMAFILALAFIVWLMLYIFILHYFLPKLAHAAMTQADARSEMTGRIVDTYANITTVKLFSHSQHESNYAKQAMGNFLTTQYPQMRLITVLIVSLWCVNIALFCSVTCLSLFLWSQKLITVGVIAVATTLALRLFTLSEWLMWEIAQVFEQLGIVQDGMNTLKSTAATQPEKAMQKAHFSEPMIKFDKVCFRYHDHGKHAAFIINQFSLNIHAGEKVAFVGKSGAGKSTLVNLLLRFYDPQQGTISIGGHDIANIEQSSLRESIAVVSQDTALLNRSIKENILYGKPDASDEPLRRAAERASAHHFILDLIDPDGRTGYEARVGERGLALSGGQRQRIAIARALLKNAPIFVLDEATSALDSEAEQIIQENLDQLMQQKTVIAIAHRLSTITKMDKVVVIEEGKIVEIGTHAALIQRHGHYARLWQKQTT